VKKAKKTNEPGQKRCPENRSEPQGRRVPVLASESVAMSNPNNASEPNYPMKNKFHE
jgi:hypothetical protein